MNEASAKVPVVLLHGWGVNRAIWDVEPTLRSSLSEHYELHVLDLPGYGMDVGYTGSYDLEQAVARVLDRAPQRAVWVGWSLGATIAMQIALSHPQRLIGLQLISPTPRFMQGAGWVCGMAREPLENLRSDFLADYDQALKRFLMLQTSSRRLIRGCFEAVLTMPRPHSKTIDRSLTLLAKTDLREQVEQIDLPTQIVFGNKDRIVPPAACLALHKTLAADGRGLNQLEQLKCSVACGICQLEGGHLCFLENSEQYFQTLLEFTGAIGE
jgi:pimeloyl-[acyl-carrier protein] methyl ester esterase